MGTATLDSLSKEIKQIKARNVFVEENKAWETSNTRRIALFIFTYLSLGLYMHFIGIDNPWLNAVIPSIGFLLSTLTLPFIKEYWKKHFYSKKVV